ncbi:aldo/keto reductase [Amycolatopsis suaedae]|uniref:aldo/keto reductase n=1 Tax=Amycolatopsis suaedae TaxID=2510978 RepID=UPI001F0F6E5C|nr:aldo/keto reductase [Amycolatopsis suaedae]
MSEIGLGCSSMSHGYGPAERDDEESIRVLHRAVELGITIFDTADVYGPYSNEYLLGRALSAHRDKVRIATKCGLVPRPDGKFSRNGSPEHLRAACEASLRRLRVDAIDLYQLHRVDPAVPLAESWGALGELVTEGKVRGLGISHATPEELEEVHAIFPITAIQYELSVWVTKSLDDILPWTQKNGVGFLAFCPIGRGYLSGRVNQDQLGEDDSRKRDPRFAAAAMARNQAIVDGLNRIAARHGATPAQVAIAWTLTHGDNVVPIPGTRRLRWLEENAAAARLRLTVEDLRDIAALPKADGEMVWDRFRSAPAPTGS